MPDYAKCAEMAERLIRKAGRTVSLVEVIVEDVSEAWNNRSSEREIEVPAVQLLPSPVRIFGLEALGEANRVRDLFIISELVFLIYLAEDNLAKYTLLRDDEQQYKIDATQSLRPAEIPLIHYVGVTR